jgi:hypothetical protein
MKIKTPEAFAAYCTVRHDVDCNQKYGKDKYYSYHLGMVADTVSWFRDHLSFSEDDYIIAYCGAWGHDLIEDARVTYNDIVQMLDIKGTAGNSLGEAIADVIYACTEEKGRNREERHSAKFFYELRQNKLAVFVKLCDVISNIIESKTTGNTMFNKYKNEYPKLKDLLYMEEYSILFFEIERLLEGLTKETENEII